MATEVGQKFSRQQQKKLVAIHKVSVAMRKILIIGW
jgi:hypothetical protein